MKSSIAAGHKMVRDANLQEVGTWLQCKTASAAPELRSALGLAIHTHPRTLLGRQQAILRFRAASQTTEGWDTLFTEIAELERDLLPTFRADASSKDDLEKDALAQLSFQESWAKPLNNIPFMVTIIAMFKIWIVPTITIASPILMWILPYLLLKCMYSLPISHDQYMSILKGMWTGGFDGLGASMMGGGEPDLSSFWSTRSIGQMILFGFSFLQGIIQPIQNAIHLYRTDTTFWSVGRKLISLREKVDRLRKDLGRIGLSTAFSGGLDHLDANDYRRSFIFMKEHPKALFLILRQVGALEALWRVSRSPDLTPTRFVRDRISLESMRDVSLESGTAVTSSLELQLGKSPHAVITGPNGGGKSSVLRAVLQSVLFGHAYGVAPAKAAAMPRLLWIASGLQLRDTPGKMSMFETEVKFAADAARLATGSAAPGLILFDELFHSTNPPDGTRTAQRFLSTLWSVPTSFSIVSTHIFPLVEAAPPSVQAICCPAEALPSGEINYSFQVAPGLCKVSSVHKVWKRFGLRAPARPVSHRQNLPVEENSEKDGQ